MTKSPNHPITQSPNNLGGLGAIRRSRSQSDSKDPAATRVWKVNRDLDGGTGIIRTNAHDRFDVIFRNLPIDCPNHTIGGNAGCLSPTASRQREDLRARSRVTWIEGDTKKRSG